MSKRGFHSIGFAENNLVNSQSVDCEGGECELVWGPGSSRIVVIRSFENHYVRYSAFDLRTGELLCQDINPRPDRPLDAKVRGQEPK